jgi:hypothetical protein
VSVSHAITGSDKPIARRWVPLALWGAGIGIAMAMAVLVSLSIAQASGSRSNAVWRKHHEDSHKLPDELFHRDRFRAIRGRVSDEDGKPVAGALVRCVRLESLVELARAGVPSASTWRLPIEAETTADEQGRYEFPICPSAGGRSSTRHPVGTWRWRSRTSSWFRMAWAPSST